METRKIDSLLYLAKMSEISSSIIIHRLFYWFSINNLTFLLEQSNLVDEDTKYYHCAIEDACFVISLDQES